MWRPLVRFFAHSSIADWLHFSFTTWRCAYLSAADDGLEPRATQSVDSERRNWDGDATPQTHVAGNVRRVG